MDRVVGLREKQSEQKKNYFFPTLFHREEKWFSSQVIKSRCATSLLAIAGKSQNPETNCFRHISAYESLSSMCSFSPALFLAGDFQMCW